MLGSGCNRIPRRAVRGRTVNGLCKSAVWKEPYGNDPLENNFGSHEHYFYIVAWGQIYLGEESYTPNLMMSASESEPSDCFVACC